MLSRSALWVYFPPQGLLDSDADSDTRVVPITFLGVCPSPTNYYSTADISPPAMTTSHN